MPRRARPVPPCPCGLGPSYDACCGRWTGEAAAPTPELLMRSRYTAYARGDVDHLLRTWHSSTRPGTLVLDPGLRWTGLQVLASSGGGLLEPEATVAFRAAFTVGGRREALEEDSRFVREDGRWAYLGPR